MAELPAQGDSAFIFIWVSVRTQDLFQAPCGKRS